MSAVMTPALRVSRALLPARSVIRSQCPNNRLRYFTFALPFHVRHMANESSSARGLRLGGEKVSVEPVITDGSEDGSELVEVRDARVAPMRRPTPHGDKLRELLNNSKLPAPDLPRVRDAIGRYEEWIASVAALTIPKRTIASGLLIPPSTTALAAAPWSHSRIWPALLPWQEARLSQSRGTSSATLSQSRHTHQASWRSNHSHIPPLSNISTACSRSKRSCFNPRTTDTKSLPFPGLQFRCPRNGRQFTPRLSFPEVSPPSLGAACRHLTTVPPRIEAGAAAEVPPGSCLP